MTSEASQMSMSRRRIIPGSLQETTRDAPAAMPVNALAATPHERFQTTYGRSYHQVPERGERYARQKIGENSVGGIIAQSRTSMADAVPTQLATFQNPKRAAPQRLTKIQQPKVVPFAPQRLEPTQTKCK